MDDDERDVVAALRRGDEATFRRLIERYRPGMLWVARRYVRDRATAEEVVQETWLAVIQGIDRFEERSSFKTWLFRILANRAKTRGQREGRSVPFSALDDPDSEQHAVDPDRFLSSGPRAGWWSSPPAPWGIPEDHLAIRELLDCIRMTIDDLPPRQRTVIALRDIDGWSADEVSDALEISDGNQRVLLHRARSKVRMTCGPDHDGGGA